MHLGPCGHCGHCILQLNKVLAGLVFTGRLIPLRTDGVHYQWNDRVHYMQSICAALQPLIVVSRTQTKVEKQIKITNGII